MKPQSTIKTKVVEAVAALMMVLGAFFLVVTFLALDALRMTEPDDQYSQAIVDRGFEVLL